MAISNAEGESASTKEGERKRKRRGDDAAGAETPPTPCKWRSPTEQKTYSSKLLEALRRVHGGGSDEPPRSRAVREAADRALAVAARGRTRWSRAILSSRPLRLKATRRRPHAAAPPRPRSVGGGAAPEKRSPAIRRKARVLSLLVPGCKKLPFPALLDETSDYIAALEMQVRAMSALADILSAVGGGGATTSSSAAEPPPPPPPHRV
ncbi:Transcription factor bHLH147 [Ananas comosus]|uniref:Transcription factor bHLH147 n=1 Tax=Ananas comosus TaxID=4615 RepID=A0A199VYF4_ANACO|nr:Transcription factor bHLH147 [Ananas comosus]